MVISDEHRFVFVEVPHTGSHSISTELCSVYGGRSILRKHANLTQFERVATAQQKKYFKFAAVRNPLDTVVTEYFKYKSNHKGQYTDPSKLMVNGGSVTDLHLAHFRFVHDEGADFPAFFRRYKANIFNNWFLVGHNRLDFVLRFENIDADYIRVLKRIGVTAERPLPHVNPTRGKLNFEEYYTPEIQELAVRAYGPFLRKWGYQIPESWDELRIPTRSVVSFELIDRAVNFLSKFLELDPDAPHISRMKKLAETWVRP